MSDHLIDLPMRIDRQAGRPLHHQLAEALREAVCSGLVAAGERLPSSRALARSAGVSRTVVTEAFQQLYTEGWLEGRHGSGTYVAAAPPRPEPSQAPVLSSARPEKAGAAIDLRPGRPWTGTIDAAAWKRAWRHAGTRPPRDAADPHGVPELRRDLADHLRRARGVAVDGERVLITRGTGNAADMLAATLLRPGDRVGVEEPCFPNFRAIFAARGAEVVPCPVDEHGLIPEELPDGLRLLHTTPAHQYPLGGRLPVPRRLRLLEWARNNATLIVEDDYDAEFRYDVAPLPALYGLGPDRVVLLGSLSKTLTADLGIGWLVGEPALLGRVAERRAALSDRTPGPVQDAVSFLARHGDLERHLRRMRAEYARRRNLVKELLGDIVPLRGDLAGLHVVAELTPGRAERAVAQAKNRGVLVSTLADHYCGPQHTAGLLLGYGSASLAGVKRGCRVLRDVLLGDAGR